MAAFTTKKGIYPKLSADHIQNPSRFFATPFLGGLIKIILLLPVFIELYALAIAWFFLWLLNSLVVFFTGNYMEAMHALSVGILRIGLRTAAYFTGLSNSYPGFGFGNGDTLQIDIPRPEKPNRLFAIPLLGGLARIILLIPFAIYEGIIRTAGMIGVIVSSFVVLFSGKYPESTYEMARDSLRLNMAQVMYVAGLSDKYPNFWISLNHQSIKIVLIILGLLGFLANINNNIQSTMQRKQDNTLKQWSDENLRKAQELQKYQQNLPSSETSQ